jgi:hypothetical protein
MALTTVGSDSLEPPGGTPGCWCCGDRTVPARVVRLGAHPRGRCGRCVHRGGTTQLSDVTSDHRLVPSVIVDLRERSEACWEAVAVRATSACQCKAAVVLPAQQRMSRIEPVGTLGSASRAERDRTRPAPAGVLTATGTAR